MNNDYILKLSNVSCLAQDLNVPFNLSEEEVNEIKKCKTVNELRDSSISHQTYMRIVNAYKENLIFQFISSQKASKM